MNCVRDAKSGWWFPNRVYDPSGSNDDFKVNGNCDYNKTNPMDTNLNACFNEDATKNQRGIVMCTAPNVDDCYKQKHEGGWSRDCGYFDYEFKNIEHIKLSKTKIYLGRKS